MADLRCAGKAGHSLTEPDKIQITGPDGRYLISLDFLTGTFETNCAVCGETLEAVKPSPKTEDYENKNVHAC
jgi:hypothetical protein